MDKTPRGDNTTNDPPETPGQYAAGHPALMGLEPPDPAATAELIKRLLAEGRWATLIETWAGFAVQVYSLVRDEEKHT